ncbi:MAG: hypothetical protein ACREK6_18620 [Candidatus Rokuibacteriota bacterium]
MPGVGPITTAELRDIARKSCPEIAWINSDVTAEGLSDLIFTAECGFSAAARLRRGLVDNAAPELGAGPARPVPRAPAPTPPELGESLAGAGTTTPLIDRSRIQAARYIFPGREFSGRANPSL